MNIAILGYGTIGSGVYELAEKNKRYDIQVKKVLDIRDLSGTPAAGKVTKIYDDILNDDSISLVVETMGGEHPAYEFTKAALLKGKHVVTSNKALVAAFGTELLKIAAEKNLHFLFEASVGGAIPIIRALTSSLAGEKILKLRGILNGTTNYILTRMEDAGAEYGEALKEAQSLGYAEADPTADVEGWDTCRKIAILASIVTGKAVDYRNIPTEGIVDVTLSKIKEAASRGEAVKLLGVIDNSGEELKLSVSPVCISKEDELYGVRSSFNAVMVEAEASDRLLFYGRGAGRIPTAGAVLGDIVEAIEKAPRKTALWS